MLTFEDEAVLTNAITSFKASEHCYKAAPDPHIFQSQSPFRPLTSRALIPILIDFDGAEKSGLGAHIIQPVVHRAPEVMLGWSWRDKADIWNLGLVVCSHVEVRTATVSGMLDSSRRSGSPAAVVDSSAHRTVEMGRTTLLSTSRG